MKSGIRRLVTTTPLKRPRYATVARQITSAIGTGLPKSLIAAARATLESVRMAPLESSMPRVVMTAIIPTPRIMITDMSSEIAFRFPMVQEAGQTTAITIDSRMILNTGAFSETEVGPGTGGNVLHHRPRGACVFAG